MDPPARTTFTNGKSNNGHAAGPNGMTRMSEMSSRSENPVRSVDRVRLGLDRLLKLHDDLPAQAAVLGVCDDGLPVLLDLNDPASGAVVVIGDEREAQLDLLRTVVASVASRGTPSSIQFVVFSCQAEMWRAWIAERGFDRHCLAIVGADDERAVREWVIRLADWTEQRLAGQRSGPPVIVVTDSLSFLPRLAYDVRLNFDWMAKEGPGARIWPVATVSTELATALGTRMLRGFASRILGFADDPTAYMRFASLDEPDAARFGQPGTFAIRAGDSWLRFHLPRMP